MGKKNKKPKSNLEEIKIIVELVAEIVAIILAIQTILKG